MIISSSLAGSSGFNWLTAQDCIENYTRDPSAKCLPPCSHFVEYGSAAKQVRASVDQLTSRLLRRHVRDGAQGRAGVRQVLGID